MADNIIEKAWDASTGHVREEFLRILHKRYNFGRICTELLGKEECWFYRKMAGMVNQAKANKNEKS